MKELQRPGLRLLASGAVLDKDFFNKDFSALLQEVKDYGAANKLDLQLDDAQIEAARAAHSARDIQQVFSLAYWPMYDDLREDGTIPEIAAFWEM